MAWLVEAADERYQAAQQPEGKHGDSVALSELGFAGGVPKRYPGSKHGETSAQTAARGD